MFNNKENIIKISLRNTVKYIVLLIFLSISISYLTLLISLNVKYAIDGVLFNNYKNIPWYLNKIMQENYILDLFIIAIIIVIINVILMLLNYYRSRITTKLKLRININLKASLYKHVLNLEYESYNSYDKSEMMQRINDDAEVFSNFFNSQFNVILDIVFLSIFIIRESTTLSLSIACYIFITILIMLLFSLWYLKKLNVSTEKLVEKRRKLLNATIINVGNSKLVRMFNKQKEEKTLYKRLNDDYTCENVKFIKLVLFYDIIMEHITYMKKPIIFILGGIAIIKGKMSIGALTALLNLSGKIFDTLYIFGENLEVIDDFYVVTKKINKLLKLREENKENYMYDLEGDIIFSNVTVQLDNKLILENMNFVIKQGEKVAIIGENGTGKSILVKTLLGFYKYDGNIYINNHNIKRINKQDIRKYIELILSESYMFSGTILENLVLDNKIEDKKIKQVVKDCEIKTDIEEFKDKYNTLIGEKGTKLSGGQKQRICIARSLINNKQILILDKALNKLDNETKRKILINIKEKYKDKTIIFITDNLEITSFVDSIIYIDKCTTIKATHKELMGKNKNYKNLVKISEDII